MSESIRRIELEYHSQAAEIIGKHLEKAYPPEEADAEADAKVVMHAGEILRTLGAETAAAYIGNATGTGEAEHDA